MIFIIKHYISLFCLFSFILCKYWREILKKGRIGMRIFNFVQSLVVRRNISLCWPHLISSNSYFRLWPFPTSVTCLFWRYRRLGNMTVNHKNYNFLDCDWFKKLLFFSNSLAKLLSDISISQSHSKLQLLACARLLLCFWRLIAGGRRGGLRKFTSV